MDLVALNGKNWITLTIWAQRYSNTPTQIQEATRRLNFFAKQVGLNISGKKTEVMALTPTTVQSKLKRKISPTRKNSSGKEILDLKRSITYELL